MIRGNHTHTHYTSLVSYCFGLYVSSNIDREREKEEKERVQATPVAAGCTSYRLHRLLSFPITNVFHLFSLCLLVFYLSLIFSFLKKKQFFLHSFLYSMISRQHTSIIYILYNTVETGLCE
jgi:hypothetical protein